MTRERSHLGRGRPPLPEDQVRCNRVLLLLTNPETEQLRRFAAEQRQHFTVAIRNLALEALERRRDGEPA